MLVGIVLPRDVGLDDGRHLAWPPRQKHDPVRHIDRLFDTVGHEDEGFPLPADELKQVLLEFPPRLLIDGGERLIHQEHLGIDRQRPRETHPLPHAAGKFVWMRALETFEPDGSNILAGDSLALGALHTLELEPKGDVAHDIGPGHQGKILKDEGALGARSRHPFAVDADFPRRCRNEAGDDFEQRGFPAPRWPQQARQLALRKIERDAVERFDTALIDLRNAAHLHHGRGAGPGLLLALHGLGLWLLPNSAPSTHSIASMNSTENTMMKAIAAYILGYSAID